MRTIAGPAVTALNADALAVCELVELQLVVPTYLTSLPHDVVYGGNTYVGVGNLGEVGEIEDSIGDNKSLRLSLSGVPSENIALALGEEIRGKACIVRLAIMDATTNAILDAPIAWSGTLDQMPIQQGKDGRCVVAVTAEHRGITFGRPKPLRYTDIDQRRLFSFDTSMRFILSQSNHQDIWPSAAYYRI